MKNLIFLFLPLFITLACRNDDRNNAEEENAQPGTAAITLTASGEAYKITGPCGWATVAGQRYIGANDSGNSLKTFSTYFNIDELPAVTTSYILVKDMNDTDPAHIWMNISEIRGGGLFEYTSNNSSGILTLKVEGKKVTVDLSGIVLQPTTGPSGAFTSLNTGAFSHPGTLSGNLVFYKD